MTKKSWKNSSFAIDTRFNFCLRENLFPPRINKKVTNWSAKGKLILALKHLFVENRREGDFDISEENDVGSDDRADRKKLEKRSSRQNSWEKSLAKFFVRKVFFLWRVKFRKSFKIANEQRFHFQDTIFRQNLNFPMDCDYSKLFYKRKYKRLSRRSEIEIDCGSFASAVGLISERSDVQAFRMSKMPEIAIVRVPIVLIADNEKLYPLSAILPSRD